PSGGTRITEENHVDVSLLGPCEQLHVPFGIHWRDRRDRVRLLLGNRLPEHDLPGSISIQLAILFPNVRSGCEELAPGTEHVGDLMVGVLDLQGREIELPSLRVELQD